MRAYHKLHPPQLSKSGLSEVAKSILEKPISVEVNFTADNLVIFSCCFSLLCNNLLDRNDLINPFHVSPRIQVFESLKNFK